MLKILAILAVAQRPKLVTSGGNITVDIFVGVTLAVILVNNRSRKGCIVNF